MNYNVKVRESGLAIRGLLSMGHSTARLHLLHCETVHSQDASCGSYSKNILSILPVFLPCYNR